MSDNQPSSVARNAINAHQMDEEAVRDAYRRWAPVYDYTFGMVSTAGRRHAVELINSSNGKVLEVGVGTGLSLISRISKSPASTWRLRCWSRRASASNLKA